MVSLLLTATDTLPRSNDAFSRFGAAAGQGQTSRPGCPALYFCHYLVLTLSASTDRGLRQQRSHPHAVFLRHCLKTGAPVAHFPVASEANYIKNTASTLARFPSLLGIHTGPNGPLFVECGDRDVLELASAWEIGFQLGRIPSSGFPLFLNFYKCVCAFVRPIL